MDTQASTSPAGSSRAPADLLRTPALLDDLDEHDRIRAVASLGRRALAALYEAAATNPPLHFIDFVPAAIPPRTEVIHEGKNSLPMFTRFQKRFCRPPSPNSTELWGYNEQSLRPVTGPGYFVVHHNDRGELVIDYRFLPEARPEEFPPGWPPMIPNSARLSRFIYNGTVDVMRRVSQRVTVGRAHRNDKAMDAWFALVRCSPVSAAGAP